MAYVRARSEALAQARKQLGIGEGDANALLHIAAHPGIRPSQLREHLGITSPGVTALIDRLVSRGIVRRDLDPSDRRVNRISVTVDLGDEPWAQLTRFDSAFDDAVLAGEEADAARFAELLESWTTSTNDYGAGRGPASGSGRVDPHERG
nr:MarR family winged helix-turn-helix transcriptional regulator [Microbacterium immunditiarum]